MEPLLLRGGYVFVVGLVLAHLEIQIEGKDGWAAKLPTWRWHPAWMARPITGYLVCMTIFLLLVLHLPILYTGFTAALEGEVLAFFFLLTVFWDFQWFVWNPHFGVRGFRRGNVWWYRTWWGPLPADYFFGLAISVAVYVASGPPRERAIQWAALCGEFVALTLVSMIAARVAVRPVRPPFAVPDPAEPAGKATEGGEGA